MLDTYQHRFLDDPHGTNYYSTMSPLEAADPLSKPSSPRNDLLPSEATSCPRPRARKNYPLRSLGSRPAVSESGSDAHSDSDSDPRFQSSPAHPQASSSVKASSDKSLLSRKRRRASAADSNSSVGVKDAQFDSIEESVFSPPSTPILRPSKRPKPTFVQHASHWTPEGNVLVQIENIRFKLTRSRLMKHSGYFRRVLQARVDGEEMKRPFDTEDAPVIFLDDTGVGVDDFVVLLDALEDFLYVYSSLSYPVLH
jgi:hypothetical protein